MLTQSEVFMARQPIYDRSQVLAAYEILYRADVMTDAGAIGTEESAQSLVTSLVDIGLNRLAGDVKAFINVDQNLLLSGALEILPKDRVVLELLETLEATPENLSAVKLLRAEGFSFALDDFVANLNTRAFVPYSSILKFDVVAHGNRLADEVRHAQRTGVMLLAEKVETASQFERCKGFGFELYQGYYFSRPEIVKGRSIPPNKLAVLDIVSKLHNPDLNLVELEDLITAELALAHRLLRMVKSAYLGIHCNVTSIRQAIMFLGLNTVATLATLLAMSASSSKPKELMITAFVRARMCELLARVPKLESTDCYFTVGLLSVIDALLDAPMADLVAQLPLSPEMNAALIGDDTSSDLACTLHTVLAFEDGRWDSFTSGHTLGEVSLAYREAVSWAAQRRGVLEQSAAA